jgi:hypothetical protein
MVYGEVSEQEDYSGDAYDGAGGWFWPQDEEFD